MASLFVLQLVPRDLFDVALKIRSTIDEVAHNTDDLKRMAEELHQDLRRLCNHAYNPRAGQIEARLSYELSFLRNELYKCLSIVQTLAKERNILKKLRRKSQIRNSIRKVRHSIDKSYQRFLVSAAVSTLEGIGAINAKMDKLKTEYPRPSTSQKAPVRYRVSVRNSVRTTPPAPTYLSRQDSSSSDTTLVDDDARLLVARVNAMLRKHSYSSTTASLHPRLPLPRCEYQIILGPYPDSRASHDHILQANELLDDLIRSDWIASGASVALSLSRLTVILCELDLPDGACQVARACTDVYRDLAAASKTHLPSYARSLYIHSALLTATHGDAEIALERSNKAVILFEYLQVQHPGKYDASLSTALTNYSNSLCALGEYSHALQVILQSVDIQRGLYSHQTHVTSSLCCALHNLAQCLLDVGGLYSIQLALDTISETIELVERLAHRNSVFKHVFATCLLTYSHCLVHSGDYVHGIRMAEKALQIRRTCATTTSIHRNALLAETYSHLSSCYSMPAIGDHMKALSTMTNAVGLQRGLLNEAGGSVKVLDGLAYYLYRLAMLLSRVGKPAKAILAVRESVTHREHLAIMDPPGHNADLAQSLHDLGVMLHNSCRYAEAKAAVERAVSLRKKLVMTDGKRYGPALRNSKEALMVIQSSCFP